MQAADGDDDDDDDVKRLRMARGAFLPSRLAVLAIALVLPLAAAHAGTVAEWRQNATTSVAMVDEVMDEVLPPEPSVLKPAGDEIDPEIVEQIEASMEVGPAEEDDDEVYQAPKRRQRASRRDHAQTGVGTKIEDATRVEDQVSVDGKASSACSQSNQIILAPYLQSGSPHRMVVRWRSSGRGRGVVCYGTSPESMTSVAREHGQGWPLYAERKDVDSWDTVHAADHNVEINNLDPHTTYYYAIGTEPEQMPRFETRSVDVSVPSTRYWQFTTFPERMSEQENPVRVWAIGDSGWGDHKAKRVRDAFLNFTGGDWDLTLGLGDLAYLKGKDWEYQKRFFKYLSDENAKVPVFTTPGNHDTYNDKTDMKRQIGPYFDLFTNPGDGNSGGVASNHKSYYSFDYGKVHFVSVDSQELGLHDDPTIYAWLERDLEAASKAGYDWIVAYHHQPPYSKGSHDSDREYECYKLRSNLVPTFEKYGVDLVLAGHSHSYERSHLLNGHFGHSSEVNKNPRVVKARWSKDMATGVDTLVKAESGPNSGTVYIVTGGGAIRGGCPLNHPAMAKTEKNRGSTLLEFDGKELRIWLLGEHRDDKDDYSGYNVILDEAVVIKKA